MFVIVWGARHLEIVLNSNLVVPAGDGIQVERVIEVIELVSLSLAIQIGAMDILNSLLGLSTEALRVRLSSSLALEIRGVIFVYA